MNYINLINQFWRIRRSKRITGNQADVYYCLMQECNERGWENPFEFPNMSICARIGITEPTLIDARARLKQLGLINFEAGERKVKSPVYELLYLNDFSKTFSLNRAETEDKPSKKVNILNKTKHKPEKLSPVPPSGEPPKPKFDFVDSIINEFTESYLTFKKIPYEIVNPGKERKAAGKILKLHKLKFPEYNSEQSLKALRSYFDACNQVKDTWLSNNMSLSIIIDKFNEINNKLRNGNKRTKSEPATTDAELAGVFAKHFATDYTGE